LAPATIAFSSTCKIIVEELLHSDDADPNNLKYANARDEASLRSLADTVLPVVKAKSEALTLYLSEAEKGAIRASAKVVNFWKAKKDATQTLLEVYENAKVHEAELGAHAKAQRTEFFKAAKLAWEVALVRILLRLNEEIIGPYTLGEQYSLADPHLTAWLARVVSLAGGTASDNGITVIEKLEKHMGSSLALPTNSQSPGSRPAAAEQPSAKTKLAVYWDAVKERPSWKKVYANGLH